MILNGSRERAALSMLAAVAAMAASGSAFAFTVAAHADESLGFGWNLPGAQAGASSIDLAPTGRVTDTTGGSFAAGLRSLGLAAPDEGFGGVATTGSGNIRLCVLPADDCRGGSIDSGLQSGGKSDPFALDMKEALGTTPKVTPSTFAIKFQTPTGSFEFPGGTMTGTVGTPVLARTGVAEPDSLVLMAASLVGAGLLGAALIGLFYFRTRLRRRAVQPVEAAV
jgi:hypothetical protein